MCTSRLVMCADAFAGVEVPSGNDDIKCAYLLLCWICGWLIAPELEPVTYGWLNVIVERPLRIELLVFAGYHKLFFGTRSMNMDGSEFFHFEMKS
ncbi:hypothetical protein AYI70_g5798 [Smittium culicis]|uniref:Uncharacterized protein n=1 Tax=Smittium culicis TaxID=133412 RepID=A0A1R1XT38_9FUNG|nr:hypothetical protein AYI70_g5798 [Smittium culicis]